MYQLIEEEIRPSKDLRNCYGEISRECRENRKAVIITVNGRADTVSLGYAQYKETMARLERLELLDEGEKDYYQGKISSSNDVSERIDAMLEGAFS